jgi:hypothetical protein
MMGIEINNVQAGLLGKEVLCISVFCSFLCGIHSSVKQPPHNCGSRASCVAQKSPIVPAAAPWLPSTHPRNAPTRESAATWPSTLLAALGACAQHTPDSRRMRPATWNGSRIYMWSSSTWRHLCNSLGHLANCLLRRSSSGDLTRSADACGLFRRFALPASAVALAGHGRFVELSLDEPLSLEVGNDGIIGRRVSLFTGPSLGRDNVIAEGIVGFNFLSKPVL